MRRRTGAAVVMLFVASSAGVLGQGQFGFNNRVPSNNPEIDARFVLPTDLPGTSTVGTGFQVQLFAGPDGTPLNELLPTDPPSTGFRVTGTIANCRIRYPGVSNRRSTAPLWCASRRSDPCL